MIHLYSYNTPNSYKVSIALEELGLEYVSHAVNVRKKEQLTEEHLRLNPAGKVPFIRDEADDLVLSESNAILVHLAQRAQRLLPKRPNDRAKALQWLFFQAASVGPMFGEQVHYRFFAPEKLAYAMQRYETETRRVCSLIDLQLQSSEYLAAEYSIADIAVFSWFDFFRKHGTSFAEWPAILGWLERVAARPAVARGVTVPLPHPALVGA